MRHPVLAVLVPVALVLVATVAGSSRSGAAGVGVTEAPPAPPSIGIRLLEAPADAEGDPRAQVHIVDHLFPGTVIQRKVEVSTTGGTDLSMALYPSAATIEGGSFTGAEGRTANEVSSWTSVTPSQVLVPADGAATAEITIVVPGDAAPGERYGVVWAEVRSAASEEHPVTQVARVGMRIYLSIGPGAAPAADFEIRSITAGRSPDGAPTVLATVENTGGRALDLAGALELSAGPGDVRAGPFPATLGTTLAVGDAEPVTIVLDGDLPAGPWDATIRLRSGVTERTATGRITFPRHGLADPVPASRPGGGSPLDVVVPVAAVLAIMALGAAAVRWRHRLRRAAVTPNRSASPRRA